MGVLMSPSSVTTEPSADRRTAEPMCRDSTKPLRSITASSTAESTVKVACGLCGILPSLWASPLLHGNHHRLPARGTVGHGIRPLVGLDLPGAVGGPDFNVVGAGCG